MPDSIWSVGHRPEDRDERHEDDGRERRERDVEPPVSDDHVVRSGLERQPRAAMEERVGEVEEVAPAGVEVAIGEPVDDRRDGDDHQPDDDAAIEAASLERFGHAPLTATAWRARIPTPSVAPSATANASG